MRPGRDDPRRRRIVAVWLLVPLMFAVGPSATAQEPEQVAVVTGVSGSVEVCDTSDRYGSNCREVEEGDWIESDEWIRTRAGRVHIRFDDRFSPRDPTGSRTGVGVIQEAKRRQRLVVKVGPDSELGVRDRIDEGFDPDRSLSALIRGLLSGRLFGPTTRAEWLQRQRHIDNIMGQPDTGFRSLISGTWTGTWPRDDNDVTGIFTLTIDTEVPGFTTASFDGQPAKDVKVSRYGSVTMKFEPASECEGARIDFEFVDGAPVSGSYATYGNGCTRTGEYSDFEEASTKE